MSNPADLSDSVLAWVVAIFFLGMGLLALAVPERITVIFGQPTLTPAGRNEVRAVYGGFGVAMAAVIVIAGGQAGLRQGAFVCIAAALGGMALGRVIAAAIERPTGFYPSWFYAVAETLMAAALLTSL